MDWLCWEKNIHPNIEASPKWLDWASFVFANTKIGCVSSKTVKNLMYNKMKDWKWCLWLPAYARDHGNHPFAEGLVWVRFVIFTLLCHLLQCWEGYGAVWKHRFWSLSLSLSPWSFSAAIFLPLHSCLTLQPTDPKAVKVPLPTQTLILSSERSERHWTQKHILWCLSWLIESIIADCMAAICCKRRFSICGSWRSDALQRRKGQGQRW